MLNVSIGNYRITSDSNQFIVMERHVVDPTLAPNWASRNEQALRDGKDVPDDKPYEKWREIAYYGLRTDSLTLALDYIRMKTLARSDATTLEGVVRTLKETSQAISDAFRDVSTVDLPAN